ncbi:dynactin subunit 6 [Lycorma delicatula]|uniref:dynactin subunit 6 n=1 Tax=Lycorma delicatula TaxID=130591 RepID=UPI003F516B48
MSSSKELKISHSAVVCVESKLRGVITIGSMTVIHPRATIIAEAGPVFIGENNIIEEQACIFHRLREGEEWDENRVLLIGANNVFEVGCSIYARVIGDHNVFEAKCYVGIDIEITNGCIIGAGCELTVPERLQDNSVISGSSCALTIATDKPPAQTLQLEFLSKVLPNYHHLKKTTKKHESQHQVA